MKKFHAFCHQYQVSDPFPVTERVLCSFAAFMADGGLAPQTVKSYLAAIRNTQLSLGLPDPREQSSLPILKRVLDGIKRARFRKGPPARIRLPITTQVLHQIKATLESSSHPDKVTLWAVCCTAFLGSFVWENYSRTRRLRSITEPTWHGGTWQSITRPTQPWCVST